MKDWLFNGPLGRVKLKHVWILSILLIAYFIWREGWPSPAIDSMMLKAAPIWWGALIGLGIDAVHFHLWPPSSTDPDYENRRRRSHFLMVGMLAGALSA